MKYLSALIGAFMAAGIVFVFGVDNPVLQKIDMLYRDMSMSLGTGYIGSLLGGDRMMIATAAVAAYLMNAVYRFFVPVPREEGEE